MGWVIEKAPEFDRHTVEWAGPDELILSRRNRLLRVQSGSASAEPLAVIGAPAWKSAASVLRPIQRLLRFQVTNVLKRGADDFFVTFDRTAGIVSGGRYTPVAGLARPCRVLRGACAADGSGDVYFGEYLANDDRGPMRLYRLPAGSDRAETVHEFGPGAIRHIHGIYADPIDGALFCLTGDRPEECRIIRSRDGFGTIETIGEGDESWRAVSILFGEKAFFYGTDAEHRANVIYRLDRSLGSREALGEVSGTVFYAKQLGDAMIFTTAAENAPSQTENVAAIWIVEQGRLAEVAKFPKDGWHPTLFQFGTIQFPNGPGNGNEIFFTLVGVKGDNRTFRLKYEPV